MVLAIELYCLTSPVFLRRRLALRYHPDKVNPIEVPDHQIRVCLPYFRRGSIRSMLLDVKMDIQYITLLP